MKMNNKLRLYTKNNPEELEFEGISKSAPQLQSVASPLNITVDDRYIKPESFKEAKSFIVIFSGGKETEKKYFHILGNSKLFPDFRCDFLPEPKFKNGMEPLVFDFAETQIERYKSSESESSPDKYYIVSDVDDFYESLVRNKERCDSMGASLVISNPCFEVWLYYSKFSDCFEGCVMPQDKHKYSQTIKTWYNRKGTIDVKYALFDIKQNIQNARANYQEDENLIPQQFSTSMYRWAEDNLSVILTGICKAKKERENRNALYKSQNKK